ncbi:MAG: hypothetical protein JNK25_01895 [Phycisphaerae bacterium]|nr:hypothetical protein [Phycisphaerae bacterium]
MTRLFTRRGFALADAFMLITVVFCALALLMVAGQRTRRLSSLGESMGNLRQFGSGLEAYAADSAGLIYSYSWRAGVVTPSTFPDLRGPFPDALSAAAAQAVDILRRRGHRPDMPVIQGWIPHIKFWHLVLSDYLGSNLPMKAAVSPEDQPLSLWASDPAGFDRGQYPPQPSPGTGSQRWPYSSSYEMGPAFYSSDFASGSEGTISQSTTHNTFVTGAGAVLGGRRLSEVVHPSQKAFVWDSAQRHFGTRVIFFAFHEARVPVCFTDGSVRVRPTASANRGFNPTNPRVMLPTTFTYQPTAWEAPLPSSGTSVQGVYRYTRNGLGGRDFDGDEVPVP